MLEPCPVPSENLQSWLEEELFPGEPSSWEHEQGRGKATELSSLGDRRELHSFSELVSPMYPPQTEIEIPASQGYLRTSDLMQAVGHSKALDTEYVSHLSFSSNQSPDLLERTLPAQTESQAPQDSQSTSMYAGLCPPHKGIFCAYV